MFQRLLAWHENVITLAEAGAPVALPANGQSFRTTLEAYAARVALAIGRGVELPEAIAHDVDLPASYRSAALVALRGDEESAFEMLSRPAATQARRQSAIRRALTAPAVLLVLVLIGAMVLLTYLAPALSGIYLQMQVAPDRTTRLLVAASNAALPLALVVAAVVALIGWQLYRGRSSRRVEQLLKGRGGGRLESQAALAHRLAGLIRHGFSPDKALEIAGRDRAGTSTADLPPLIDWALRGAPDSTSLIADLEFAADVYGKAALRQADQWRRWAPAITAGVGGGLIVLTYGLAVFLPLIRLLERLARPL